MNGCPPNSSVATFNALRDAGIPVEPGARGSSLETKCGAIRVNIAGNKLGTLVMPQSITPLERLFRKNSVEGTLTATPQRPFIFELGAIEVPAQMAFVLLDTRFAIHVPSGIAPGDSRELEDRRLASQVGYDIKFTDTRRGNLLYELDPSDPSPATATYSGGSNAGLIPGDGISGVSESLFNNLKTQNQGLNAASGLSTMPQRHRRDSQLDMPFTYIITENKRVNFEVIIFRPIPIPISWFEVEVSGYLIGQNAILDFADSIKPCVSTGGV